MDKDNLNNAKQLKSTEPEAKKKRGQLPRMPLKKVIGISKAIYDVGQGEPVRRVKVFEQLGKSAGSSLSRQMVTASGMYGLTSGGYQAEYLTLTEVGKQLASEENGKNRLGLIYNVLFKNDIFSSFVDYWKDKALPSDDIASDWLLRRYSLAQKDANNYWIVIKDNISEFKLTELVSGKQYVISRETASKSGGNADVSEDQDFFPSSPTATQAEIVKQEEDFKAPIDSKTFGTEFAEKTYKYGKARLVLPGKMTQKEFDKLKLLIESMIEIVGE